MSWTPTKLTRAQMEERRLAAVKGGSHEKIKTYPPTAIRTDTDAGRLDVLEHSAATEYQLRFSNIVTRSNNDCAP